MDRFIFGTYKKKHVLNDLLPYVYSLGITCIDTSQLYTNESFITDILESPKQLNFKVNTQISKQVNADYISHRVKLIKELFGHNLNCILLHNRMSIKNYQRLHEEIDGKKIGVSNYNMADLECMIEKEVKPDILQIEFHPFTNVRPIILFCKQHNIKIQGHTILAQAKYLDLEEIVALAKKYNKSPALIMIRWAFQFNIDLILSSSNRDHINEWLQVDTFTLSDDDHSFISNLYIKYPILFYTKINTSRF
jgi:diketogulonate reductase-like aldo/keto reductase